MGEISEKMSELDEWLSIEHPIRQHFTDQSIRLVRLESVYQYLKRLENPSEREQELFLLLKHYRSSSAQLYVPKIMPEGFAKHLYFDWDGTPIQEWEAILKGTYFNRSVAKNLINGWIVSTVWLMINHNHFLMTPLLIFETMIFKDEENTPDNEELRNFQARYSSYSEAQEGHLRACELVKRKTEGRE